MFYKCILLPEGKKKNKKTQVFKKQRAKLQMLKCDLCDGSRWCKMWATDGYSQKTP